MLRQSFRALDGVLLLTTLALSPALARTSLASLWPCLIGAALAYGVLPTLGAYAYDARESVLRTLARVAGTMALAGLPALLVARLVSPEAWLSALVWTGAAFLALCAMHTGALIKVRAWRREGRLTPNILVVGATENAMRLVETALATREVAVLGVFDDRSDRIAPHRSWRAGAGRHTAALVRHRILPFVDRIVLTVNAAGPARTAELIERLRVLPNELCLFLDAEDAASRASTLSWLARSTLSVGGARARESRQVSKRVQDWCSAR